MCYLDYQRRERFRYRSHACNGNVIGISSASMDELALPSQLKLRDRIFECNLAGLEPDSKWIRNFSNRLISFVTTHSPPAIRPCKIAENPRFPSVADTFRVRLLGRDGADFIMSSRGNDET